MKTLTKIEFNTNENLNFVTEKTVTPELLKNYLEENGYEHFNLVIEDEGNSLYSELFGGYFINKNSTFNSSFIVESTINLI